MSKNILERLEDKFNSVMKFSKSSFTSTTLENSDTPVEYASNEVGVKVYVGGSTGSQPAPNDTYKLPNGDEFVVVDGEITEVITVANAGEEVEMKEEDEDEKKVDEVIEEVKADEDEKVEIDLTPVEEVKADELDEVAELKKEIEELKKALNEKFSKADAEKIDAELTAMKTEILKAITEELKKPASFSKQNAEVKEEATEDKFLMMARMNKNKNK
ncbi:hypothetical protein [Sphingobacterium sp. IITKGP-BTPF85]|uniref:hypothetical protein n=1 Tax=Sphingobacterium sp. IITKGP-BTPF85 TaxID=1338009 RepID=UPI00038A4934|nr:hypothetical protein [Sphingobacterium sp. IITKGP-BTPF85]KKX49373.1 hypothetical protein L950_0216040 [Sphingobacterium sp. IITKGP-BTPF85]